MDTLKKTILFIAIILCATKGFSQDENKLPFSIYSPKAQQSLLNSELNINTKLDLKDFNFMILDKNDLENGIFNLSLENIGRTITSHVYDSYKKPIFNKTAKYYNPKNGLPFYYVDQTSDFR